MAAPSRRRTAARPKAVNTLAIDIGGTGMKASVLDGEGQFLADPVRVETQYPCAPADLVQRLADLVTPLPAYSRISAGFPGVMRGGRILSAPHFATIAGPGTAIDPKLARAWAGFDLASALQERLGSPVRIVNDAELQGAAVISGQGLELVITLGTGLGTALFHEGEVAPHLELAHHPFRKGETYNEQVGEAARKRVGKEKWNRRVLLAVQTLDALLFYDRLYVGGGNGKRVTVDLGPKATFVENRAGILGGITLWEGPARNTGDHDVARVVTAAEQAT